jgi:hypothetical protein
MQSPLQPAKVEPGAGVGVSQTLVPQANEAPQTLPQLIPPGLLVTEPDPVPARVTERLLFPGVDELNVAVTLRA